MNWSKHVVKWLPMEKFCQGKIIENREQVKMGKNDEKYLFFLIFHQRESPERGYYHSEV